MEKVLNDNELQGDSSDLLLSIVPTKILQSSHHSPTATFLYGVNKIILLLLSKN